MYLGQYDSAIKIIDEIIRIDKQLNEDGNLARSYAEKAQMLITGHNNVESATEALEQGLKLKSSANLYFYEQLFHTYLSLGEHEKALEMEYQISNLPYSNVIVRAYQQQSKGNFDKAIRDFQFVTRKGWIDHKIRCGFSVKSTMMS